NTAPEVYEDEYNEDFLVPSALSCQARLFCQSKCKPVDPDGLQKLLRVLKSVDMNGLFVDCWWEIVEEHVLEAYN
ncbi:hypothetical protein G4B88_008183, partial [Cannabis sativa]